MKIVHISIYPPKAQKHAEAGGVASYTKNLVISMTHSKKDEIFVLCNKLDACREEYKEDGLTIIRCFDKGPKYILQLIKEIRKISPDIIHFQQELSLYGNILTAYLLQWLLFWLRKYCQVITLHGVVSLNKIDRKFIKGNNSKLPIFIVKYAFRNIYIPLCKNADRVFVHEELFKDVLINEYGICADKISVIHHGIENLKPMNKVKACKDLKLNPKNNIVLFMGYLTGYKGLDLLIEGFSRYAIKDHNSILLVGAGVHPKFKNNKEYKEEYNRIKNKAEALIPKNQLSWKGFIPEREIISYYSAADVSIYPYTVSIASSGPMSIAIGYNKPFLTSHAFDKVFPKLKLKFSMDKPNDLCKNLINFFEDKKQLDGYVKQLKKERIWSTVSKKVYNVYLEINEKK